MNEAHDERDRFRELKKAWKPPKWFRRPAMWGAFVVGLAAVGYEAFRAVQLWLGGAA